MYFQKQEQTVLDVRILFAGVKFEELKRFSICAMVYVIYIYVSFYPVFIIINIIMRDSGAGGVGYTTAIYAMYSLFEKSEQSLIYIYIYIFLHNSQIHMKV